MMNIVSLHTNSCTLNYCSLFPTLRSHYCMYIGHIILYMIVVPYTTSTCCKQSVFLPLIPLWSTFFSYLTEVLCLYCMYLESSYMCVSPCMLHVQVLRTERSASWHSSTFFTWVQHFYQAWKQWSRVIQSCLSFNISYGLCMTCYMRHHSIILGCMQYQFTIDPSNPFTVCYPAVGVEIACNLFGTFSGFDWNHRLNNEWLLCKIVAVVSVWVQMT